MYKDSRIEILSSIHPEYRRCSNCHAPFHLLNTVEEVRKKFYYTGIGEKLKMCFICYACIRPKRFFYESLGIRNLRLVDDFHDIIYITKKRKGLYFPGTTLDFSVFSDTILGQEYIRNHAKYRTNFS